MIHPLEIGSVFAGHRVDALVARGGMGVIYRATQLQPERPVALKLVAPERVGHAATRERLRREAEAAASIDHPNVVPIYQAGEENGQLYIAMRWVEGTDLSGLIKRAAPIEPVRAAGLVAQIADALGAAHDLGLLHRDVKPSNVLVTPDEHLYLADFGLTRRTSTDAALTRSDRWVGTLDYVAPEQIQGLEVGPAADVYSLGCVLFELLTGRRPFHREADVATLWGHVHEPPPSAAEICPAVGPRLDGVVRRAMAKAAAERFASAPDLGRAALAAAGADAAEGAAPRAPALATDAATGTSPLRAAMPPVLERHQRAAFVARETEVASLQRSLEQVRSDRQRGVVVIAGEPGAGKTRLVSEFCRSAWDDGARVLYGRCDVDALASFQPFVEALAHYTDTAPVDDLRRLVKERAVLMRMLPKLAQRLPELEGAVETDAESERLLLFEACSGFLADLSRGSPVILVLDDLHWADRPTLLLLKYLARAAEPASLMMVVTYRDTELDANESLADTLSVLRRERLVERVELGGLDAAGVELLVGAWSGKQPPAAFAQALHSETGGNPFFVEELLRHLAESGAISAEEDRWLADLTAAEVGIPEQVQDAIAQRLARLGERTRRVLATAAVIGRSFDLRVLERIVEMSPATLLDCLDEAVKAEVILEAPETIGSYAFSHALVREALHESFTATHRAHLHRQIAVLLEELYAGDADPPLDSLAYHFFEARHAGEAARAITYSQRAGLAALGRLGYEEAVRHLERALGAAELANLDAAERCDLVLMLADALEKAGEAPQARERFRNAAAIARLLGDGERLARAALGCAGRAWQVFGAVDDVTIDLLEEALEALPERDNALRAMTLGSLSRALYFRGSPERQLELTRDALGMSRRLVDAAALCATLDARHWALWRPGGLGERLSVSKELVTVAVAEGAKDFELLGRTWLITDLLERADLAAVDREMAVHARLADEVRQPYFQWLARGQATMRALLAGDLEDAERLAQETWEIGQRASDADAVQTYGVHMFILRDEQDRMAELVEPLEVFTEQYPTLGVWRAGLAFAYARTGRRAEARAQFELLAHDDFGSVGYDSTYLIAMRTMTHVCSFLGDAERAQVLLAHYLPYDDGRLIVNGAAIGCFGAVSHWLGLLEATAGDAGAADAHLRAALDTYERLGARLWAARAERDRAPLAETPVG